MGCHLGHASSSTRRTKPAPLATERHQQLVVAGVTAQAEKAVRQDATPQIVRKFTFHIRREARGLGVVTARGEEGLQVLGNHMVEHRLAGIPGCVGGNRWRHTNPRRQQGGDGSTRSRPQLYCSFVQYASKMLSRRCGGNTGTHHHAAAATLRCPRGGGAKSAFEILIRCQRTLGTGMQSTTAFAAGKRVASGAGFGSTSKGGTAPGRATSLSMRPLFAP